MRAEPQRQPAAGRDAGRARAARPPSLVHQVQAGLSAPSVALHAADRRVMERGFGRSFGDVRVHADALAGTSALGLRAAGYSVGRDLVFAPGAYRPGDPSGHALLAHELAHVAQDASAAPPVRIDAVDSAAERQAHRLAHQVAHGGRVTEAMLPRPPGTVSRIPLDAGTEAQVEPPVPEAQSADTAAGGGVGAAPTAPTQPRPTYVFIMGADTRGTRNPFYTQALAYYSAHMPGATFVTDQRDIAGVLSWLVAHAAEGLIGSLYIVAHANEDGTLSFGLDGADRDHHLTVSQLRDALHPARGLSALPDVSARVDAATGIHIKGCDIGRTRGMVELIDEAFGGAGTVTAPTHEQVFGTDPTQGARARDTFRAGVRDSHPMPAAVDGSLRGAERATATRERRAALRARETAIRTELAARRPEEDALVAQASHYAALSGPMFQRPGTQLYEAAELRPEVDALYGHLSARQRQRLVTRLIARDRRREPASGHLSTVGQQGQRVDRWRMRFAFSEPRTVGDATRQNSAWLRSDGVRLTSVSPAQRQTVSGGEVLTISIAGTQGRGRDRSPWSGSVTSGTEDEPLLTQVELNAQAQPECPNPERYAWRFSESHSAGRTTREFTGERVLAYLHHASLDADPHTHFAPATSDTRFYAPSSFSPPPPPSAGGSSGRPP